MNYDLLLQTSETNTRLQDLLAEEEDFEEDDYMEEYSDELDELNTIQEADEESSQTIQSQDQASLQNNQIEYLISSTYDAPVIILDEPDTVTKPHLQNFRQQMVGRQEEQKNLERKFQRLLREQAEFLLKQQKSLDIKTKLGNTMKPEKVEQAVRMMQEKEPSVIQKPIQMMELNSKGLDKLKMRIENLNEEILSLKLQHNEDQEIIKTLKFQILKSQDSNTTNNSSFTSRGSNKSKPDIDMERLIEENNQMKRTINEERQTYKTQMSRVHKVHSALNNLKQSKASEQRESLDSETIIKVLQQSKIEQTQQITELRTKIKSLQMNISQLGETITAKDKEIVTALNRLDNQSSDRLTTRISELTEELKIKQEELDETKEDLMIDNQIRMIFPKYGVSVVALMNLIMQFEESKNPKQRQRIVFRKLQVYFVKGMSAINDIFTKLAQYVRFRVTQNPIMHPSNQELIKHAMIKIRASPTVLENTVQDQHTRLQTMQSTIDSQNKEIETLKEGERDRVNINLKIDELHRVDKISLANNFMMKILKREAEQRDEVDKIEIPEIKIVKEYMDLIYKSAIPKTIINRSVSPKQKPQSSLSGLNEIKPTSCTRIKRHDKRNEQPTMMEKKQKEQKNQQLKIQTKKKQ